MKKKIVKKLVKDDVKVPKEAELALEHLIEETLANAYNQQELKDELEGHGHLNLQEEEILKPFQDDKKLKSREEKFAEFKKIADEKESTKTDLKIAGVRKSDGSECCGGGCCDDGSVKTHVPVLTKKEYFDLINNVLDPETGIGIVDMGLIYNVEEFHDGLVEITMTLTSMGCPAGAQITTEIDSWIRLQKHINDVKINVVWEPAWNPAMMNPDVKAMMFGN